MAISLICETLVKVKDAQFDTWLPCCNPIKYKVSYNSGTSGKRVERLVCGVHKATIEKACKGLEQKTTYKTNFTAETV